MSYGAHPPKVSKSVGCTLEEAETIFNRYHTELYPEIDQMREKVEDIATKNGKIHLGLGCYLRTSDPRKEARTIFNACSQFWSILTLLTIDKFNTIIHDRGLDNDITICSSIYDSIYLHITNTPEIIKVVNDTIIPLLKTPFLTDMIVQNEAVGEISFNWCDGIELSNNASIEEIEEAIKKARELV